MTDERHQAELGIGGLLSILYHQLIDRVVHDLRAHGYENLWGSALYALVRQEPGARPTVEAAARRLGLTRTTAVNLLRLLEESGCIAADGDLDAPGTSYELTARGEAARDLVHATEEEVAASWRDVLGDDDYARVSDSLHRLIGAAPRG